MEKEKSGYVGEAAKEITAYMCPAGCGCLWRDNGDETMSLYGPNSKSCLTCEPMSLSDLVPLKRVTATTEQPEGADWKPDSMHANAAPFLGTTENRKDGAPRTTHLGKWISVDKEWPPRHQNVLCFNRDGRIFEGRICMGMHKPFFTYPYGDGSASNTAPDWIDVTHWQPLPEGPCKDCDEAAKHAYSDATTPGFFFDKCAKHREGQRR